MAIVCYAAAHYSRGKATEHKKQRPLNLLPRFKGQSHRLFDGHRGNLGYLRTALSF